MIEKFKEPVLVTKSSLPPIEEYSSELKNIWDSRWLTNNGSYHEKFKEGAAKYLKVKNLELFTNGHLALEIAIKLFKLSGEIITTPFTFASTAHSIKLNGIKPIFCDINSTDFTIDADKIEALITEKTTAIMPVHVYGNPCNIKKIEEIARKYNLKVIYDAAHTFGVEVDGKGIGEFGDISMFSCHATKVFHSIEGGILTFNDEKYKRDLYLLKNFGISGPECVELVGTNAKMNEFQALMGVLNLKYIDENIEKRKKATFKYREMLGKIEGIRYLDDMEGVKHNYSYFPVIIDETKFGKTRDELYDKLSEYNVIARKYFYPLVNDFNCYKDEYSSKDTPVAKYFSDRVLTLPIYADIEMETVEKICNIIGEIKDAK